jgi:hypothetical protein
VESMTESVVEMSEARAGSDRGNTHWSHGRADSATTTDGDCAHSTATTDGGCAHSSSAPASATVPTSSATTVETTSAASVTTAAASVTAAAAAAAAASGRHSWLNQADSRQGEQGYNRFPHHVFPPLDEVALKAYNTFAAGLFGNRKSVRGKLTVSRGSRALCLG